jgi:hypothetical protein
MRIVWKTTVSPTHRCDLTTLIIRAKYHLWNLKGRPLADPHSWLCQFLLEDEVKASRGVSNFTHFRRACKQLQGKRHVKVTLVDVWKNLAIYLVRKNRESEVEVL